MALSKLYNIALDYTIYYGLKSNNLSSKKPVFYSLRRYCSKRIMKVLNVAEKPDAAKNIAGYLSRGTSRKVTFTLFILSAAPLFSVVQFTFICK